VFKKDLGGIGPTDQLNIVKNSAIDGPTMIPSDQWINLPVGYSLNDHVGVSEPLWRYLSVYHFADIGA
jgi:hypothetical protein